MGTVEVVVLIGTIVEKLGAMILKLIATGGGKPADEVRTDIKALVDSCTDDWLAAEVKKHDAKFNTPG